MTWLVLTLVIDVSADGYFMFISASYPILPVYGLFERPVLIVGGLPYSGSTGSCDEL